MNAFNHGGEPSGCLRDPEAGSNRPEHRPSPSMQRYYDYREEDDPEPLAHNGEPMIASTPERTDEIVDAANRDRTEVVPPAPVYLDKMTITPGWYWVRIGNGTDDIVAQVCGEAPGLEVRTTSNGFPSFKNVRFRCRIPSPETTAAIDAPPISTLIVEESAAREQVGEGR